MYIISNREDRKLTEHLKTKPDSVDARAMLQQLYWRKGDTVSYQNEIVKLCQLHLKAQDKGAAWHDYEEFQNSGGQKLPAATWLELCRYLEEQQRFDRAVSEYRKPRRCLASRRSHPCSHSFPRGVFR